MFCNECGKEISDKAEFCPFCGHKIEIVKEEKSIEKVDNSELIEQYRGEIRHFARVRKIMMSVGIPLFAASSVLHIVFKALANLYLKGIRKGIEYDVNGASIRQIYGVYHTFEIIFLLLLLGGIVITALGVIPNTIKMTKRKNKIEELEGMQNK